MFLYEVMSITHPKYTILRSPQKTSKNTTCVGTKKPGRGTRTGGRGVSGFVWRWSIGEAWENRAGPSEEILKSWEGKGNNSGNIGIFNIWDGPFFGEDSLKSSQMKKNMILIDILKFDGSCVHAWPMAYLIILSLKPTVRTWKLIVGRRSFPFWSSDYFQGQY